MTGMTEVFRCNYGNCKKEARNARRASTSTLRFCGVSHKNMYMDDLYERLFTERPDNRFLRPHEEMCLLPGCTELKRMDPSGESSFDFCRKIHALQYVKMRTRIWAQSQRLCNCSTCYNHVYVEELQKKRYDFCCFEHATLSAATKSVSSSASDMNTVLGTVFEEDTRDQTKMSSSAIVKNLPDAFSQLIDTKRRYSCMDERDIEKALLALQGATTAEELRAKIHTDAFSQFVVYNILESHPWEILPESRFTPRYFLWFFEDMMSRTTARKKDRSGSMSKRKKFKRTTKEGFGWKQTGRSQSSRKADQVLSRTYFVYKLKKRSPVSDQDSIYVRAFREDDSKESRWIMHEFETQSENKLGRVVVSKVFENEKGGPEWPPLNDANTAVDYMEQEASAINPTSPIVPLASSANADTEDYDIDFSFIETHGNILGPSQIVEQFGSIVDNVEHGL